MNAGPIRIVGMPAAAGAGMLQLFVAIVVPLIVLGLVLYLVSILPLDAKIMQLIRVVAVVLAVLWLLAVLFGWSPLPLGAPTIHHVVRGC